MSTVLEHAPTRAVEDRSGRTGAVRRFVGGFYLFTAGVNAGMVLADPEVYREFASESFFPFVTNGWHDIVMANPVLWFVALAVGELALGLLLLRGGPAARVGWAGVLAFQVLLMLFGFGFWMWSLPVLAVLVPVAWRDWPRLQQER